MKLTWKKGLALLLTLTLVFGFSLQAVASEVAGGEQTVQTDPVSAPVADVPEAGNAPAPVEGDADVTAGEPAASSSSQPAASSSSQPAASSSSQPAASSSSQPAASSSSQPAASSSSQPAANRAPALGGETPNAGTQILVTFDTGKTTFTKPVISNVVENPGEPAAEQKPDGVGAFKGWFTAATEGSVFDFASPISEATTLYAQYATTELTVTFTDGNATVISTKTVAVGGTVNADGVTLPPVDGKKFMHWAKEGTDAAFDFAAAITESVRLVPVYAESYYVYFNSEGTPVAPQMVRGGEPAVKPETDPERLGYTFKHWSAAQGESAEAYDFASPVAETLNLYAVWEAAEVDYSVQYWKEKKNITGTPVWPTDYESLTVVAGQKAQAGTEIDDFSKINAENVKENTPQFFQYGGTEKATIDGNGLSIVNVYMNRVVYTQNFYLKTKAHYFDFTAPLMVTPQGGQGEDKFSSMNNTWMTFEAKYEQDIASLWPALQADYMVIGKDGGGREVTGIDWEPGGETAGIGGSSTAFRYGETPILVGDYIPASGTEMNWYVNYVWSDNLQDYTVQYYYEALDGATDAVNAPAWTKNEGYDQVPGTDKPSYDSYTAGRKYVVESFTYRLSKNTAYIAPLARSGFEVPVQASGLHNTNSAPWIFVYNRQVMDIQYITNGGTSIANKADVMYGTPLSTAGIKPADPKKDNATFAGWYYDSNFAMAVDWENGVVESSYFSKTQNGRVVIPLYAKWNEKGWVVSYYPSKDKMSGEPITTQDVVKGQAAVNKEVTLALDGKEYVLTPGTNVPGYGTFEGWYYEANGTEFPMSYEMGIKANYDLYARWKTDGFTVKYVLPAGASGTAPTEADTFVIGSTATVKAGENLAQGDKIFVGWKSDLDAATYFPGALLEIKGNTTLTAMFADKNAYYTVTYKAGFDGPANKVEYVAKGNGMPEITLAAEELFAREGFTFTGWAARGYGTLDAGSKTTIQANVTFTAQWKSNGLQVEFVAGENGILEGTTSFKDIEAGTEWGTAIKTVPTPKADDGYYFAGWNETFPDKVTENKTYTANFEKLTTVTFTAKDAKRVYDGTTLTEEGVEVAGLKDGDTYSVTMSRDSVITDKGSVANKIDSVQIMRDGTDVSNEYNIEMQPGLLEVTAVDVSIVVQEKASKTYGETDPLMTATIKPVTEGGYVGGLVVNQPTRAEGQDGQNVGRYEVTATYVSNPNYNVVEVKNGTLTINKAELTVTADPKNKKYGEENPEFSVQLAGLKNGDTVESIGNDFYTLTTTAEKGSDVGEYPITVVGSELANYTVKPVNSTLTVVATDTQVVITPNAASKTYGQTDPTFTATVEIDGVVVNPDQLKYKVVREAGEDVDVYQLSVELGNNPNYNVQKISTLTNTLTINKAELTVTADPKNKKYGEENPEFSVQLAGLKNGDTVESIGNDFYTLSTTAKKDSNVGKYPINVDIVVGSELANYTVKPVNSTLTVVATDTQVVITPNAASKTYGQTDPTFTATVGIDGVVVNPDQLNYKVVREAGEDVDVYQLSVELGNNPNYNVQKISTLTNTFTINKAELTVTADPKNKKYGEENPEFSVQLAGLKNGDTVESIGNDFYTLSTTAKKDSNVGEYPITVVGSELANYTVKPVNSTLTVVATDTQVVITPNSVSKTYGQTDPTFTATVEIDGAVVNPDQLNYKVVREAGEDVKGYQLSVELGNNPNYNVQKISTLTNTLTINKAELTVTADPKNKKYGEENPEFSAQVTGHVNGDTVESIGNDFYTLSTTAKKDDNVGEYPITVVGSELANYTVKPVNSTLTVVATDTQVVITPNAASKTYGQTDPTFTATVEIDGVVVNPDQLDYKVVREAGEDVNDYQLSVELGNNPNYNVQKISTLTNTLTINKAELTVTADPKNKKYGEENPEFSAQVTGHVNGDTVESIGNDFYTLSTTAEKDSNVGEYPITVVGSELANYTVKPVNSTLTVVATDTQVVITPNGVTQEYGDPEKELTATVQGALKNSSVRYTLERVPGENVGSYEITVKLVDGGNNNYSNIVLGKGTYEITPAPATITANNKAMVYGETIEPELDAVVTGAKNGETLNYTLARNDAANKNAGTYAIHVTAGSNPNYTVNVTPGEFVIAPRGVDVVITPNGSTKVYGAADPELTATVGGTVNGDELDYTIVRAEGENVGNYELRIELGNNPNYVVHATKGNFSITPATVTITVDNKTKVVGGTDPELTAKVDGMLNGETLGYTLTRAPGEDVGTYRIEATVANNPNYKIVVNTGVLDITPNNEGPVIVPINPEPTAPGGTDPGTGGGDVTPPAGGTPAPITPVAPIVAPAALPVVAPVVTANPLAGLGTLLGALTNLNDPANPLANQTVNIGNNEVPLAGFGSWALVNLILAAITVLISLVLLVTYFMGRKKKEVAQQADDDYEYERAETTQDSEEVQNKKLKRKLLVRLGSVLVAVVAVIAFILTEDMSQPMVLIDNWTLLMAIITFVQVVVTFFAKKVQKNEEKEDDTNDVQPMNV